MLKGGYCGHPNASRCEWALNGANPTSGTIPAKSRSIRRDDPEPQLAGRRVRLRHALLARRRDRVPQRELRRRAEGQLLVTRYSASDDNIVLTAGGTSLNITASQAGIPGFTGFVDPLDITEDRRNGSLYVSELGASRITLVRPNE